LALFTLFADGADAGDGTLAGDGTPAGDGATAGVGAAVCQTAAMDVWHDEEGNSLQVGTPTASRHWVVREGHLLVSCVTIVSHAARQRGFVSTVFDAH
jgi:hypothetical protein